MAKTKKASSGKKKVEALKPKDSALDRAISQIEKQYGSGSIMKMDETARNRFDGIGTGALSLDIALGGFGIPRGRVSEFFGPESSGKTTLALHAVANAQKQGGIAAFGDSSGIVELTGLVETQMGSGTFVGQQKVEGDEIALSRELVVTTSATRHSASCVPLPRSCRRAMRAGSRSISAS